MDDSSVSGGLEQALVAQMEQAHALHGMVGRVFQRLGGEEFMYEWGKDNPGRFLNMMIRLTPTVAPMQGVQGDVNIHVHPTLAPTELDRVVDEQ